jgi:hypothetical protein
MSAYREPAPVLVLVSSVDVPDGSTIALVNGTETATGDSVTVASGPRMAGDLAAAIAVDGPQIVAVEPWQVVRRYHIHL